MDNLCEFCWLPKHQKESKRCYQYRNILFTCKNCNFSTKGIKNIDDHISQCFEVIPSELNDYDFLRKQVLLLTNKNSELEKIIEDNNDEKLNFKELSMYTTLEKFKNKIFRHIIEQNTGLHLDDIVINKNDGLHIHNLPNTDISVFIHEHMRDEGLKIKNIKDSTKSSKTSDISDSEASECSKSKKRSTKNRSRSRYIKASKVLHSEINPIEQEESEEEEEKKEKENITQNLEELLAKIKTTLNSLKTSKSHVKTLNELKNLRKQVFPLMTINDFQNLLNEHIKTAEIFFKEKDYSGKKLLSIVTKSLTSLEARILSYGDYTNTYLDMDELEDLVKCVDNTFPPNKEFIPFEFSSFCNRFYNYTIVILPIKETLIRNLKNHGFANVVYIPIKKSTIEDPFSYYILQSIKKDKRCWKMDCRLDELTESFINNLLPYMIVLFRKFYRDVFKDNDYRENYKTKTQITECDCEQLLQNIIILSKRKEFCNLLRTIIREKSFYRATDDDRVNLSTDDSMQRKKFQTKDDTDSVEVIKQLFDGITNEQAVDFYRVKVNVL